MNRRHFIFFAFLVVTTLVPLFASGFTVTILNYVFLNTLVVLGLVLLTGVLGLISFGQAAFVGIGAYTTAWLTTTMGLSPWLGLPASVAVTAALAFAIGAITLRMGGHYLAIATLAWGISIYYLFGNAKSLGGFTGIGDIPAPSIGPIVLDSDRAMYWLILLILVLAGWACANIIDSRVGRAMRSIRTGRSLPESFGVSVLRIKLAVFMIAAVLASTSGWLYAHFQRYVNPSPFSVVASIEYLFMAVIGGSSQIAGALLGAGLVTLLKEWLQDLMTSLFGRAGNFEIVIFGTLMLFVLNQAKQGLWPFISQRLPGKPGPQVACAVPLADIVRPSPLGAPVLEVCNVRKQFGGLIAVNDMSFEISRGEILGLIGPNGAGKSTMFNLISGILPLSGGEVKFQGQRISGMPSIAIAARGLSRTFQHVKIVRGMSAIENVALGAWLRTSAGFLKAALRLDRRDEARIFGDALWQLERVGLASLANALAGSLPLGKQRLLEIARALAANPTLLLLDEPAAGLRALEKRALAELLLKLREEGMAILLVEHDMEFVMKVTDRLVVMNFGQKLASGRPADIQRDPLVLQAYLGQDE